MLRFLLGGLALSLVPIGLATLGYLILTAPVEAFVIAVTIVTALLCVVGLVVIIQAIEHPPQW